jgi:hypothetical protein
MSAHFKHQIAKSRPVTIPAGGVELSGDLTIGPENRGLVLFAHSSGSSRYSPRNRRVAQTLVELDFATLLMDLLSAGEEAIDIRTAGFRCVSSYHRVNQVPPAERAV